MLPKTDLGAAIAPAHLTHSFFTLLRKPVCHKRVFFNHPASLKLTSRNQWLGLDCSIGFSKHPESDKLLLPTNRPTPLEASWWLLQNRYHLDWQVWFPDLGADDNSESQGQSPVCDRLKQCPCRCSDFALRQ